VFDISSFLLQVFLTASQFYSDCERSEAIHLAAEKKEWIASSLRSSQ
jgi:hypothetical protein